MKTGLTWIAGTAASLGSSGMTTTDKKINAVSRTSLKALHAIPTTCQQCPAGCGIIAYLDGERLVQILGNPDHPNNRGGICAKGIAGINLVNDPERLLYPLKRAGARGSGLWTRITWDEVYSMLSLRIRKMLEEERISEFVIDTGQDDSLFDRFLSTLNTPRVIDRNTLKNLNRHAASLSMVDVPTLTEDIAKSRTVFNFGANPFANHDSFIGFARRLILARIEKGAKLVTFDVRMSETAAKSDAWFPLKAGTDGIVALAMARVIINKGLADSDFIDTRTDFTLMDLKRLLAPYSLESAERESGVKGSDIVQLAVEFATRKPSVAIYGGGLTDHENGTQNARCVSLLNWLVGNLQEEGGLFLPRRFVAQNTIQEQPTHIPPNLGKTISGIAELEEANIPIDLYFAYLANPAYSEPDCQSTSRFLGNENTVPFLVVMDTHMTETANLADLILPAATFLEAWGLSSAPPLDGQFILNLQQPVVSLVSAAKALRSPAFDAGKLLEPSFQPMGESVEIGNMSLELARRIGGRPSQKLPFKNTSDYVSQQVSSLLESRTPEGLESLRNKGFWIEPTSERKDDSKTLLVRIRSTFRGEKISPPLDYRPIKSHTHTEKNEFVLTTFTSNLEGNGTANSKWAREILHENRLWINAKVANQLGIKNNERVRVTSPVGSLRIKVLTTNRIHPDSVALAEGLGHTAVGSVARGQRFKSKDRDTSLIWWSSKENGVNPMEIILSKQDPVGGGLGLKDTVVQIEKLPGGQGE